MTGTKRIIIVRPGDEVLFAQLQAQYAADPDTVVLYDRRVRERRSPRRSEAAERRRIERRFPYEAAILRARGFFVTRRRRRRAMA